jgi:cyclophilin family peptidyl-prolyl cis-trans isomerase
MFRQALSFVALPVLFAVAGSAQTRLPVATDPISSQTGESNGAAVNVPLESHFTIDGVTHAIMRFDTTFGKLDVEMLPEHAPNHVKNFNNYANTLRRFDDTIIHRTAIFENNEVAIVQGGGHTAEVPAGNVEVVGVVALEYDHPNVRGTLAAARTDDPNSAGSQWYFNTTDNTDSLGPDNDGFGFTVFGMTLGTGMDVIDEMAKLPTYNVSELMPSAPLIDYTDGDDVKVENYVVVNQVREVPMFVSSNGQDAALLLTASSSDPTVVSTFVDASTLRLTPHDVGTATITVTATDVRGATATQTFTFTTSGIEVTALPESVDVAAGGNATFTVTATADDPLVYQWYRFRSGESEPTAVNGAVGPTLSLSNVQTGDMGLYFVRITAGTATVDTPAVALTLAGGTSRLANLSTRGLVPANGALTPGFVLRGADGDKELILRATGPALLDFGVSGAMADPTMSVIPQGASDPILTNDNWGDSANAAELASKSAALGAFPLADGSLDAAVLTTASLPNNQGNKGYTVQIRSTDGSAGIALAELYDTAALGAPVQLTNVSALGYSGLGDNVLVPGFVVEGGAITVLVRVAGPAISGDPYNVPGTMDDPMLEVVPAGQSFSAAVNNDWGGTAELKAAFASTGAFAFPDDNSKDAAVLVRLPPGAYTVKAEGVGETTGVVLVEVYEVQ